MGSEFLLVDDTAVQKEMMEFIVNKFATLACEILLFGFPIDLTAVEQIKKYVPFVKLISHVIDMQKSREN